MMLAQQLYEGIELGKEGTVGLITYMRTDSTRISEVAQTEAARLHSTQYGEEYLKRNKEKRKSRQMLKMPMKRFVQPVLYGNHKFKGFLSRDQSLI